MRIEWSLDITSSDPRLSTAEVSGLPELEAHFAAIGRDAKQPVIVELVSSSDARLGVGLGAEAGSVLAYNESEDPPYYLSVGELSAPDDEVVFYLHGHWTEFPSSALVPHPAAQEAAREFFATGQRPKNIEWEEV